jgi:hypothetical protein
MTKAKPKPVGDTTRTVRANAHLERLAANNGKRLVVDLPADANEALASLLAAGYSDTQKGVVSKALLAAKSRQRKKT